MRRHRTRVPAVCSIVLGIALAIPAVVHALPAPGPLRFVGPTPGAGALVTTGTVSLQLDAACSFDPGTLAVSLNGSPIPAGNFLPFSGCTGGRITSQVVVVAVSLPNGTITSGPTSLDAGATGNFTGSGSGDGLAWNFDGGAAPAEGAAVAPTFGAAGRFTVRLRATAGQALSASGLSAGNLVTAERSFKGGDPTPDSRLVTVAIPPDVDFRNFESAHVHPLALSASGTQLYAVNTPDDRLAIFDVGPSGALTFAGDVPVGVDPVSCRQRPGTNEVWVVNHLSDTVSVVDALARRLVATISVGDEPTDVVFASGRAFVTLAGRDDKVRVYNAATRAQIASLDLFGDDPRALAANAAGTEVYAVVLESGNRTTALFSALVSSGGGAPPPTPPRNPTLGPAPLTSLIVQFNPANGRWEDETGKNWSSEVGFTMPDQDVFVIDADAATPSVVRTISTVGTALFDVAVSPATGRLWIPNTDSLNVVRFEPKLRGHLVETRVSIVDPAGGAGAVTAVDLNPHIDYAVSPGSPAEVAQSLSQPVAGVFDAAGDTYYLAALGSRKVGVLDGTGAVTARIDVGGGPSGLALNEPAGRLYVMNRFDNTISTVDTGADAEIATVGVAGAAAFDPSPDVIKAGRPFLYDAQLTSGHGDIACASCHTFGNFDNLAWDLGNPPGDFVPYSSTPWVHFGPLLGPSTDGFDPMKGPMTTQTLRGLKNLEPFHWRGDRQNFQAFNGAFVSLMGTAAPLSTGDMDAYTDFVMTVNFPPNPFRNADDTMPASITVPSITGGGQTASGNPNAGQAAFTNAAQPLDAGVFQCAACHALPTGTTTNLFNGNAEGDSQDFKIPQLRNMYEKVGFNVIRPNLQNGSGANIGLAQQERGFGFLHDGSLSLMEFLAAPVFVSTTQQERDLFAFMLAFPTESAPAIGTQVTVTSANKNNAAIVNAINTLVAQAQAGKCDLIAKGSLGGVNKGFVLDVQTLSLLPDSLLEQPLGEAALRASVTGADVLTYTGVPPGAGVRLGIDRDRDGWLDRTETALGMDPANPNSNPWQF
jgi:YVTN family beta-propeller protein